MHEILRHRAHAQPRIYRLRRIDRTINYRGWFPDQVQDNMSVFDFWAVSDEPASQGEVGSQAAYVTTAWVRPGLPISFSPNILFEYNEPAAEEVGASARLLPSEVVAHFTAYLAERKFQL